MEDVVVGNSDKQHVRVNAGLLAKFHGKEVCAFGTVIRADGGGTAFQMKSSDGQQLNVRLTKPISEPLSGFIEVYGIGQGKNLIIKATYTSFPEDYTKNFDMNVYNDAVKLIHSVEEEKGNPWITGMTE